jgi:hypothetical protein
MLASQFKALDNQVEDLREQVSGILAENFTAKILELKASIGT